MGCAGHAGGVGLNRSRSKEIMSVSGTSQRGRTDGKLARGAHEMTLAHTAHDTDRSNYARCNLGALLLLAIASLLVACGGGSAEATTPNSAVLAWDAVTDPGLGGYRIYYGTAPGTCEQSIGQVQNVGNVTTYTVSGLSSGTRYYFAATAVDSYMSESRCSNEVFKDIP